MVPAEPDVTGDFFRGLLEAELLALMLGRRLAQ